MSAYLLYLRTYAKVASGARLSDSDFLDEQALPQPLDLIAHLAVTLAAHDVERGEPLKTKSDLDEQVRVLIAE